MPNRSRLQRLILELIAHPHTDRRLGRGEHYLAEAVKQRHGRVGRAELWQAYWSLVSQGLAYFDMSQPAPENWQLEITPAGQALLSDEEFNPDDASGYVARLVERIPQITPLVRRYVTEAVQAYNHGLLFASSVMLGVASEAVFLETAAAFQATLIGDEAKRLGEILDSKKVAYVKKLDEFQKRLAVRKPQLPPELADALDLTLVGVMDLLRTYRNDAGHPKEVSIEREDCFTNLRVAARYLERMYLLKAHFSKPLSAASPAAP